MENLRKIRNEKGVTQQEVADFLNVTKGAYSRYERGERKVDPETLKKLSEFFDVTTDYLVGNINFPMSLEELKLANEIDDLSNEEIISKYPNLVIDGKEVSEEEIKKMLEIIRALGK